MCRLDGIAKRVWFADDSNAGSTIERLLAWWDLLIKFGPMYGYYPNTSKTHILTKPEYAESAKKIFNDTGINISVEGERYLGGTIELLPLSGNLLLRKWKKN